MVGFHWWWESAQICMIPTVCTLAGSVINGQKPQNGDRAKQKTEHQLANLPPKQTWFHTHSRAIFLQPNMDVCAKQPSVSAEGPGEERDSEAA